MTPENTIDAPAGSFFSRLTGVFFSPGETFKDIGRAPKIVVPIIVLALLTGVVSWMMADRIGAAKIASMGIEKAVADGKMTQEQATPQLEAIKKNEGIIKAVFPLPIVFIALITVFAGAGIFKLATMMVGAENTYMQLVSVTAYANLAVGIVSSIIFVLLLYLKSPDEFDIQNPIGSNLAALLTMFMSKDSLPKFITAFISWIDLFSIWKGILLAIGLSSVSKRLKMGTAASIVIGLYLVAALLSSTWASIFG